MLSTKSFKSRAEKAKKRTAKDLTSLLQSTLSSKGWSAEAARGVVIVTEASGFTFKFIGPNADSAKTLEYGTEAIRPTGEVRKFFTNSQAMEEVYLSNLEEELGDLI